MSKARHVYNRITIEIFKPYIEALKLVPCCAVNEPDDDGNVVVTFDDGSELTFDAAGYCTVF